MSKKRIEIRKQIAEKLSADPLFHHRVFNGRRASLTFREFPSVLVFGKSEQNEIFNETPVVTKNTYLVAIEVYVTSTQKQSIDDELDFFTGKISSILSSNEDFDEVNYCILTGTEFDYSFQGEQPLGIAKMTYEIAYFSEPDTEEEKLPNGVMGRLILKGVG